MRFRSMCYVVPVVLLAMLFGPFSGPAGAAMVESTFDTDDEGWVVYGDAPAAPDYHSTGGNPGGYLSADDYATGGIWYWKAPAKFRGNHSSAYGDTLSYELRQTPTSDQINRVDIYLKGGGLTLVYDTSYNPASTWTAYSIDLTETAGWDIGSLGGAAPSQAQMQQVLGNITDLQIRGEFVNGDDTGSLDNVVMTPEPATMILLAAGLPMLLRRRRNRG